MRASHAPDRDEMTMPLSLAYSCVIDGNSKLEWQGLLWMSSLIRNGDCDPKDLKVHCLPSVSPGFRAAAASLGVCVVDIEPFPVHHVYCNKIQQFDSPAFAGYDWIVLSDADLFFLGAPSFSRAVPLSGKPVDLPNPPLPILQRIYARCGVSPSPEISVTAALESGDVSVRSNLNGGLYVVAAPLLQPLGAAWRKHAFWLMDHITLLESYWTHVDQVAMALALDDLRIPFALLTARENFPVHLPLRRLQEVEVPAIDVLHYHSKFSRQLGLEPSGLPTVDRYVARANQDIAEMMKWPVFRQLSDEAESPGLSATRLPL